MDWSLTEIQRYGVVVSFETTAYKFDSNNTRDYKKVFLVCEGEILQVAVNLIEMLSSFRLISGVIWLKVPKIAKRVPCFLADVHKDG